MTTNLTKPISKKLFFALLVVTVGAEILLYTSRYSSLASYLYDAVMVSSFFIGLRIHSRLADKHSVKKTKRQIMIQFTGAFLIFFLGSTVINIYSTAVFQDFNDDYDQYVQDYTNFQTSSWDGAEEEVPSKVWAFFDKIDTVGYDIYTDSLAGLEEVWRLGYIILFLLFFKKIFPARWESGGRDGFLMAALFLTSILFGIDHTLDTAEPWGIKIGAIVTFANMGLLFGLILLWTRSLWVTVLVHAFYDITATLSWYYLDYAVELFSISLFVVYIVLLNLEKRDRILQQIINSSEIDQ